MIYIPITLQYDKEKWRNTHEPFTRSNVADFDWTSSCFNCGQNVMRQKETKARLFTLRQQNRRNP